MAFSLLWSVGLIISIMIFAVAMGLIIYNDAITKKDLVRFSVCSFVGTFILVYLINFAKIQVSMLMGSYSYILLFLISFVLMLIGYSIIMSKKLVFTRTFLLSYACFILIVMMCVGSNESLFGLDSFKISLLTAILLNLVILIVFFSCRKWKLFNLSYKALGSMFFVLGLYCLIVSLFLPNIMSLNMADMKPINIASIESMILTFVFLIVVAIFGLWYYRKNTLLK